MKKLNFFHKEKNFTYKDSHFGNKKSLKFFFLTTEKNEIWSKNDYQWFFFVLIWLMIFSNSMQAIFISIAQKFSSQKKQTKYAMKKVMMMSFLFINLYWISAYSQDFALFSGGSSSLSSNMQTNEWLEYLDHKDPEKKNFSKTLIRIGWIN